ncbi:MAG: ATP-binding protein, partial [Bacteroidota bacterium]
HEINNPVNYISNNAVGLKFNFAELADFLQLMTQVYEKSGSFDSSSTHQAYRELETALLLKESEGLISGIQNGSRRISEVVKGMQYLSYSGENAAAIPTDIKAPIESALVIMANKLKEGIDLEREYGQTPPININPSQISQVILNLIDNAIQAVGEKGTINISSYVNGPFVCIAIKDNGIGISAEIREHIFDPFFTTRKVGEGTGLGLSISFGIIEAHGGKLEVDSLAGKGSEFIVKLPLESEFTQE